MKKIWRFNDYKSCIPYGTKRQVLLSSLKKVERMASDAVQQKISAKAIIEEFLSLGYPLGIIKYMCSVVARDSANRVWLDIRESIPGNEK